MPPRSSDLAGSVVAVHADRDHSFSKPSRDAVLLVKGRGVQGDAHEGETVQHRSRVKKDPNQPNLRQVHLIHAELLEDLQQRGFAVAPGDLGENVTTRGIDLLGLPEGTILQLGEARIEVTGLRNPCAQLDNFQQGLTAAVLGRDASGNLIRKAGIMAVVLEGGVVRAEDQIQVCLPALPHQPLAVV